MKENGTPQPENFFSREKISTPSPEQKKASEVAFYLQLIDVFAQGSKKYVALKRQQGLGLKESRKSLRKKSQAAFDELYDEKIDLEAFRLKWGEGSDVFEGIFNELKPRVEFLKEKTANNASNLSLKDRILISVKAGNTWRKMSVEQRDHLLKIAGYSKKELADISKKIGISTGLTVGLGYGYEVIGAAAGLKGAVNPFLGDFSESNAKIAIALSYLTYYSALGINAQQNLRLLRNKSINTSPDVVATGTFFLLNKLLPRNEKLQNWGTRLGSLSLDFFKEAGWAATMFIPEIGPSILVSANIAGTGLNGLQAIISEGVLRYYKPKKKNN